jgi:hypothetical protein
VNGAIEKLRRVPRLEVAKLTVTRHVGSGEPTLEIAATVANTGPGDAWGVRGLLASAIAGIEGRILYVGHVAAKSEVTRSIRIPVSTDAGDLRDAPLSLMLLDAHATTSMVPVRFHGPVLTAE